MKTIYKSIFAILAGTILLIHTSCSEDFIALSPISEYNAEQFYETPLEMEQAVNSVYNAFNEIHKVYWTSYMEMRSPMMTSSTAYHNEISSNNLLPNTTATPYEMLYQIIYRANIVLENINAVTFDDETTKQQLIGQAKFLRGWANYSLVLLFDGVPVINTILTPEEASSVPRSSVSEVYAQAEADLIDAIALLPEVWDASSYGRITKYAAKGILARVYIQQIGLPLNKDATAQWNLALPHLNDIVSSGLYAFEPDYTVLFSSAGENNSKEMILPIVYSENGLGMSNKTYGTQYMAYPYGRAVITETDYAYSLYDAIDIRRDFIFNLTYTDPTNGQIVNRINHTKYGYNYNATIDELGADFPIMRYTDVLLLIAEGEAEVAGSVLATSLSVLNQVRSRAGLSAVSISDMNVWKKTLLDERNLEFAFECVRWPDLLRTNTYVEALQEAGTPADINWRYYPIPLSELQRHDDGLWEQNVGYEHIK